MSRAPLTVGPAWPPALSAYEHMKGYTRYDWAWEGMRRNPAYQHDALSAPAAVHADQSLANGAHITRLTSAMPAETERWGLCPFR